MDRGTKGDCTQWGIISGTPVTFAVILVITVQT